MRGETMKLKLILGAMALASLAGCASGGVLDRERPDEFAVTKAAPLAIPADPAAAPLPTPQPGAPRPQGTDAKKEVLDAMFGAPKN
jgi:uncharacterized lipoprotein